MKHKPMPSNKIQHQNKCFFLQYEKMPFRPMHLVLNLVSNQETGFSWAKHHYSYSIYSFKVQHISSTYHTDPSQHFDICKF